MEIFFFYKNYIQTEAEYNGEHLKCRMTLLKMKRKREEVDKETTEKSKGLSFLVTEFLSNDWSHIISISQSLQERK